jgi:hypothetical protein
MDRLAVAEMQIADERDQNRRLHLYLDKLEENNAIMRRALEWYANLGGLDRDLGRRARDALAARNPEKEGGG